MRARSGMTWMYRKGAREQEGVLEWGCLVVIRGVIQ